MISTFSATALLSLQTGLVTLVHDDPEPRLHDNPKPLEPWAMKYNRNHARSHLRRLPTEVACLITQNLPPDGIYLLRQTSRHFRDMFSPVEKKEQARGILRSQLYCSRCRGLERNK